MEQVVKAIARIEAIPTARVDHNYGQGEGAVARQLLKWNGEFPSESTVHQFIKGSRDDIQDLSEMVAPSRLPHEYVFFLEYCGGLEIHTSNYRLALLGVGPMVEEWYGSVKALNHSANLPLDSIHIGDLSFWPGGQQPSDTRSWVTFILDTGDVVEQQAVFGLGPGTSNISNPFALAHDDTREWKKVASCFAEFLVRIADTEGKLDFL